jgi:copper transport protein
LWSTEWGRLLILKVALVGVAAAGGAYNHRVMVPALDLAPEDRSTIERFRTVVTIEAVALAGAAVVTAFLVAASAA